METAKFCRKCGADMDITGALAPGQPFEPEEETRVAVRAPTTPSAEAAATPPQTGGEQEKEIFSITPTLMFVKAAYGLAAIGALLLVALTSAILYQYISIWLSILIGLLLFVIPAFYHFKRKLVRYTLTDSKLEIDEGFVSRTTRNVAIRRIQDVTVSSNVMQRLLGFGNLVIDNASEQGGKVVLKNIDKPKYYADVLLRQMRQLETRG